MKANKLIKLIIPVSILTLFFSCDDLENDYLGVVTPITYFTCEPGLQYGVNEIYRLFYKGNRSLILMPHTMVLMI